jgi:hypothetical protein
MSGRDQAICAVLVVILEFPLIVIIGVFLSVVVGPGDITSLLIVVALSKLVAMPIWLMWMQSRRR